MFQRETFCSNLYAAYTRFEVGGVMNLLSKVESHRDYRRGMAFIFAALEDIHALEKLHARRLEIRREDSVVHVAIRIHVAPPDSDGDE
ncbi:MAG: hypothetical protein SGI88_08495 [Candidatus Hydrogenedentes bacterium]|nr:hypothetical protein [Candidatus Hydrogenedentota bacterium]